MALSIVETNHIDILCNGICIGYISIEVSGGSDDNAYLWNTGQTTSSIANLCAGVYTIVVTDLVTNETATADYTITEPTALAGTIGVEQNFCANAQGFISVSPSGGTFPYTYLWNTGATTEGIVAGNGNYSVVITDFNGCSITKTIDLNVEPVIVKIKGYASCDGDGKAIASVTGGTAPYTYLWTDPLAQTTSTTLQLPVGTYYVTVTDSIGCEATGKIKIISCEELFLLNATCCLASIGNQWVVERSYGNANAEELEIKMELLSHWIDLLACQPDCLTQEDKCTLVSKVKGLCVNCN